MPLDPTVQPNGQKIKALRLALKWSQDDLAHEAVCGKRTVENAEAGKRVKESVLIDIAAKLGVHVSELSLGDGEPPVGPKESGHTKSTFGRDVTSSAILDGHWHVVTSFEDVGQEEFKVEITSKDQSVTARATCVTGHDKGHISIVKGTFANLILCATWGSADPTRIDCGTACLMLLEDGDVLQGFTTYFHITKRVLCITPRIWRRCKA